MKCIVEISGGLGDCVRGTPLVHALHLLGHDVDVFLNTEQAPRLRPLFEGWGTPGRVLADIGEVDPAAYDFAVCCHGRHDLAGLFLPGLCITVEDRHLKRHSQEAANFEVARWLGFAGEMPERFADGGKRREDSVEGRWQGYVAMTLAQPEPDGVTEIAGDTADAPLVSVVIPTYNRADNALRAVGSALAQTEISLEVLLVDDGSTDHTPQAFAETPPRVRYFRKPNGGASSARNVGLRRARGQWIALLDSDDEWEPDKLAKQLAAMGERFVASACRHVHVNADGSRQVKPERLPGEGRHHLFNDLYENLSLKTSSLVFRRHLLERVGLFNESYPISNDWDFFLRLAKAVNNSGFITLPDALVTIHRSGDSISKTGRANALAEAYTRICSINALLHNGDPAVTRRHVARAGRKHLELSRAWRKQGDKQCAALHAREAMRAGFMARGLWRLLQAGGLVRF